MIRLPDRWQTSRLKIEDGALKDVPQLMAIFNACSHVGQWDPTFKIYPEEEFAGLVTKSMADVVGNGPRQHRRRQNRLKQLKTTNLSNKRIGSTGTIRCLL